MGAGESKVDFASKLNSLRTQQVSMEDHEFWKVVFLSKLNPEEVFQALHADDVRKMKEVQPNNLAILIVKSLEQLLLFSGESAKHDCASARTSLYLLSRILPVIYEADQMPHQDQQIETTYVFADELLLRNRVKTRDGFLTFDHLGGKELTRPLAEVLATVSVDLCFTPGYTIGNTSSLNEAAEHSKFAEQLYPNINRSHIWTPGLGAPSVTHEGSPKSAELNANRRDAMRLVLAAMSESMFHREALRKSRFIHYFMTGQNRLQAQTLFYSLLNTVLSFQPQGILPYTSWVGADEPEKLVTISLHILVIGLEYAHFMNIRTPRPATATGPEPPASEATAPEQNVPKLPAAQAHGPPSPSSGSNAPVSPNARALQMQAQQQQSFQHAQQHGFWSALLNIRAETDFHYLAKSFAFLLRNHLDSANSYLPGSQRPINFHTELLLLLWKFVECNRDFRIFLGRNKNELTELLLPVIFYMYESRHVEADVGLLQVCTFIIMTLSTEREFGVALNRPFADSTLFKLPAFTGNYFDMLIFVVHQLVFSDKVSIRNLCDHFLTILANVSPYIKSINMLAAAKLVGAFEFFAKPQMIAKHYTRPLSSIHLLLDIFNNLIQYQYEGNLPLVYCLLRSKRIFDRIVYFVDHGEFPKKEDKEKEKEPVADTNPRLNNGQSLTAHIQDPQQSQKDQQQPAAGAPPAEELTPAQQHQQNMKLTHETAKLLPLNTIKAMRKALEPDLNRFCEGKTRSEEEVLEFLRETTLVGVISIPQSINFRKLDSNYNIHFWLSMWSWGIVYLHCIPPIMFDQTRIHLFRLYNVDKETKK